MVKEENISFFSQMNWQSQRFEDIISIKTLLDFLLAAFSKLKALGSSSQVFFSAVHLLPILLDLSKDNCKLQLETANADCWAFDSTPPNPSTPSYRWVELWPKIAICLLSAKERRRRGLRVVSRRSTPMRTLDNSVNGAVTNRQT